jgi:hypothetical protein
MQEACRQAYSCMQLTHLQIPRWTALCSSRRSWLSEPAVQVYLGAERHCCAPLHATFRTAPAPAQHGPRTTWLWAVTCWSCICKQTNPHATERSTAGTRGLDAQGSMLDSGISHARDARGDQVLNQLPCRYAQKVPNIVSFLHINKGKATNTSSLLHPAA